MTDDSPTPGALVHRPFVFEMVVRIPVEVQVCVGRFGVHPYLEDHVIVTDDKGVQER